MNEQERGRRIARALNQGTASLDDAVLARLKVARETALEAHHAPEAELVLAGHHGLRIRLGFWHRHPVLLPLSLLAGLLLAFALYWQSTQLGDPDEFDADILADDLPIQAYLDKDFDEWLQDTRPQE